MNNATKIQAVINTLEIMNIPSTYDNTNKLLGIYQTLSDVQKDLIEKEAVELKEVKDDAGAADAK